MFKKTTLLLVFLVNFLVVSISAQADHSTWNTLLQKNVTPEGKVDYTGFTNDKELLTQYISYLKDTKPSGSSNDKLAFWINAYNAYTVMLVTDNYPISSIKDVAAKVGSSTPWDYSFANVGGKTYTLNQIEHEIIRVQFDQPLIHFAVNCAAKSCPKLRNEAYVGSRLDAQLTEQVKVFLADSSKNNFASGSAQVSEIFNWFKDDFTKKETLVSFLNKYSKTQLSESAQISHMEYGWKLNN